MKKIASLLLLVPYFSFAQQGINFEHANGWNEILAKAKTENKYIFVDAYTTWCGPCRYMSANIFPQKEVGEYFNKNFVNLKVQLDTTQKDNAHVKQWYADAHKLKTEYAVNVFPTYLFFSSDGKLVHRAVGASEAKDFLAKAANSLNPEKQYYTLLNQYRAGNKNPAFLRNMAYATSEVYDKENMTKVSNEYLATQSDYYTADNIQFINEFTQSSTDKGFSIILANPEKFVGENGKGSANKKIVTIILNEDIYPTIFSRTIKSSPNWGELQSSISSKYPAFAKEVIATAKVSYYQSKKDWTNFQTAIVDFMKRYGSNVEPDQLNDFAWAVFENCADMTCIKEALAWSKRSFAENNSPMFIDTYANLLYKMGKKNEAITWQEKAISLADEDSKSELIETLEKMKKGEKTWRH